MEANIIEKKTFWERRTEGEKVIITGLSAISVITVATLIYTYLIKKDTSNILSVLNTFKAI